LVGGGESLIAREQFLEGRLAVRFVCALSLREEASQIPD
jgi:hypothetical protein